LIDLIKFESEIKVVDNVCKSYSIQSVTEGTFGLACARSKWCFSSQ